jgi:hypothetical protein
LVQTYDIPYAVAEHLSKAYGGRAFEVCNILKEEEASVVEAKHRAKGESNPDDSGGVVHLVEGYPYITAEVKYATRFDWARRVDDVLARRTRLLFLNKEASIKAVPVVLDIMAKELNWSSERKMEEAVIAYEFIGHFAGSKPAHSDEEVARIAADADIITALDGIDKDNLTRGITYDEIVKVGIALGRNLSEEEIASCIKYCDVKKDGSISRERFVQWWNSDLANPLLSHLAVRMATTHDMEGGGTAFG